jgi:hypothetical protein
MDFPYDTFLTNNIFTLKDLNQNPLVTLTTKGKDTSLFLENELLIDDFINKNNIQDRNNDNKEIIDLSINFTDEFNNMTDANFLEKIYNFCKHFYYKKFLFINKKKNYLKFESLLRRFNNNKNLFSKNLRYENPITYSNNFNKTIPQLETILQNGYDEDQKTAIDNIILGHQINFSLPSIGPIYNIYQTTNKCDITELICRLLDDINIPDNYLDFIPLHKQKISDTLSSILLEQNDLWNINIGNSNNKTIKYIKQYLNGIKISLFEIISSSDKTSFNNKYIIPYQIDNKSKIITQKAKMPNYNSLDEKQTIKNLLENNNDLYNLVYQEISGVKTIGGITTGGITSINRLYYKDVLCCYIFFVINLFYDFYKKYIDKLSEAIISISSTKIGKNLNFKEGFKYIEKLNKSLLNFKLILLNSFYELFLPSSIINNYYGTGSDVDGYIKPVSTLLADNNDIINNIPFKKKLTLLTLDENKKDLVNFIFLNKNNKDIYDNDIDLDLGGFSYNKIITTNSIQILNEFFDNYKKKNNLYIYLLELLESFFKEKSCNLLIHNLIEILDHSTSNIQKKKDLSKYFEKTLFTSSKYFFEVMKIDKKIKLNKSYISEDEYKRRDIYLLTSRILSYNSEICKYIIRDQSLPINIRKNLLENINKYSKQAVEKILNMQKRYKENVIIKNINKPKNKTLNSSFWNSLKNKILNKKLLIPILNTTKSKIIFIDLIEFGINGKYSDDLIFSIPKTFNKDELMKNCIILLGKTIKDIKQYKLLSIKSDYIDKIKLITDQQLIRKNLFNLLNNILIYNKYSIEISKSLELYNLFKTLIKTEPNNFNRLIISHTQIKKISEGI